MKNLNLRKYAFEFLSIFIAVVSAFALNNWNEDRRNDEAAKKILTEISNGLKKDLEDIKINVGGHEHGIKACRYYRKLINNDTIVSDSLPWYYSGLTRDFNSEQNISGYETLKSKGLEIIRNDSLRFQIISLYEYDYKSLKMFEEEYYEMQFQENYFKEINGCLAAYYEFDKRGNLININLPLRINAREKNIILSYLLKIQANRMFILRFYKKTEEKIHQLIEQIEVEGFN